MTKDDVVIKPTTDLFIASLWSKPKNEPILRSLLSGVMTDIGEPPVVQAKVLNPFNIQEFAVDKQIRLDVRVEDEARAFYNVEVQTDAHKSFPERMLYYWGDGFDTQLSRGDSYVKLCPLRSIIISEFSIFEMLKRYHAVFKILSCEDPTVVFSEHFQMHVLRFGDLLKNNLVGLDQFNLVMQRWIQFWAFGLTLEEDKMSTMLQDCPPVLAAYEEFKRFSADPVMREKVKARERFLLDQRFDRAEAREEGKAEGLAEGRTEEKITTARKMRQEGFEPAVIAKITGLPLSEIEQLG